MSRRVRAANQFFAAFGETAGLSVATFDGLRQASLFMKISDARGFLRRMTALSKGLLLLLAIGILPSSIYAQGGVPLWTNRYGGPSDDCAFAVVSDAIGNVYVTGGSVGTATFPNFGNSDYVTIKYSSIGMPLWTNRYIGPSSLESGQYPNSSGGDFPLDILVDESGNVYVTGGSKNSGLGGTSYATIKYSSAGVPLWTNRYIPSGSGEANAQSIAVDGNGEVYVTGGGTDYATIKYSSGGVPLWTNRYNGSGNGGDLARRIALDSDGNVFLTGYAFGNGTGADFATIKYSSAGVPLWTNLYNGEANGGDMATALVVDGMGNVIVTGWTAGLGSSNNFATIAYSNEGVPLWTNIYDGPENGNDQAFSMAVDPDGNVFVSGASIGDATTVAYSRAGMSLWTNRYIGASSPRDCTAADPFGNVFVACQSGDGNADIILLAYSLEGKLLWTDRFSRTVSSFDKPWSLATDLNGNVYVTGESSYDFVTIKYAPTAVINVRLEGAATVLSWANPIFELQSAPFVTGIFTNIPGATSPHTNSPPQAQQYFRLKRN